MPRGLTAAQKSALAQRVVRPAGFVQLDIPGAPVRAWDGAAPITALGETHYGVGQFGSIEGITSERAVRSSNVTIGLNGLPINAVGRHILEASRGIRYQGTPLRIYMGLCHVDVDTLLSDPWIMWTGVADFMTYQVGESISLVLSGEHFSSWLRRINGARMSHESHKLRTGEADDRVFRFADRLTGRGSIV